LDFPSVYISSPLVNEHLIAYYSSGHKNGHHSVKRKIIPVEHIPLSQS